MGKADEEAKFDENVHLAMVTKDGMEEQEISELERLIDRTSLKLVLLELAAICCAKSEHIRVNWQDDNYAAQWDAHGIKIAEIAETAVL
jgi:hypothetical protein